MCVDGRAGGLSPPCDFAAHPVADNDSASCRLTVSGDLDHASGALLQRAVQGVLLGHRPRRLHLDLVDVSFIDTGGIWALQRCRSDADEIGCEMQLADLRPMVRRVLQIVGMLDHFGAPRAD
jgi:anti-anti-sigma factor